MNLLINGGINRLIDRINQLIHNTNLLITDIIQPINGWGPGRRGGRRRRRPRGPGQAQPLVNRIMALINWLMPLHNCLIQLIKEHDIDNNLMH